MLLECLTSRFGFLGLRGALEDLSIGHVGVFSGGTVEEYHFGTYSPLAAAVTLESI